MSKHNIKIIEELPDRVTLFCEDMNLTVSAENRAKAMEKMQRAMVKALNVDDVSSKHIQLTDMEVEAIKTVLKLVMSGKLDHLLYEEENDANSNKEL